MELNSEWWETPINNSSSNSLEELSEQFERRLKSGDCTSLEEKVIEVINEICNVDFKPDDWENPFPPSIILGERRSWTPTDLTEDQKGILFEIAPIMSNVELKARINDIAWTYCDRSNATFRETTIETYLSMPIDEESWLLKTQFAWQRAIEIARRSGNSGYHHIRQVSDNLFSLIDAVDSSLSGTHLLSVAIFLRLNNLCQKDKKEAVALALEDHATEALKNNNHLTALDCLSEASRWYVNFDDNKQRDMLVKCADIHESLATLKPESSESAIVVTVNCLENSLAILRKLPKKYRITNGIDKRIIELVHKINDSREILIESMTCITGRNINLQDCISTAQKYVSGVSDPLEAALKFVKLGRLFEPEELVSDAQSRVNSSIISWAHRTTYDPSTGQKVFDSHNAVTPPHFEGSPEVWSEVCRAYKTQIEILAKGAILPAQDVINFEHRLSLSYFIQLCYNSCFVPSGHEYLWALGLNEGMKGNYGVAASVLAPQFEHLVRDFLRSIGTQTRIIQDDGTEDEKSLNALINEPAVVDKFGDSIVFEMRLLLCDPQGVNLRNRVAHGLIDDSVNWSLQAVYFWWFTLRLTLIPILLTTLPNQEGDLND
jgi:hypothetical protein